MKLFLSCLSVFLYHWCLAQSDTGLPFVTNFSAADYRQGPQNFTVLQDNQGILYFGNNNGVLIYDGVRWEIVPVTNKSEVHALAQDEKGTIYVGAQGDFGYLQPASTGKLSFVSLLHLLDSAQRNFNDVWSIYATKEGVIFRSTTGIYIYRNGTIKVIPLPNSSHRSFFVKDQVWIRTDGLGLQKLENDSLVTVPGGEQFLEESIYCIFVCGKGGYVFVTEKQGMLYYDGAAFSPFVSPANAILTGQNVFGTALSDSTYALGTRRNGLLVMDQTGAILHKIGKEEGIIDEYIRSITSDRFNNNIWLATNNGISVLELASPFTSFQERSGLSGQFYSLVKHKGILYAAGSLGVFKKPEPPRESAAINEKKFQLMPELTSQSWHFYADSTILITSTNDGIFHIRPNDVRNIGFTGRAWYLLPLVHNPGYILANTARGLVILKRTKDSFVVHRTITQKFESLYYFVEDINGDVWVNSPIRGVYRLQFNKGMDNDPEITLFDSKDGLPSNLKLRPFQLKQGVVFGSEVGLYAFNKETKRFEWHQKLNEQLFHGKKVWVDLLEEDETGMLWGYYNQLRDGKQYFIGFMATTDGKGNYTVNEDLFKRINTLKIHDIIALDKENVFISTADGIIHLNPQETNTKRFPVLIRSVELIKTDSLCPLASTNTLELPFAQNSLRFRFAAMGFTETNAIEYDFFLEGFDKKWSGFASKTDKEYTNLPGGTYTFHVKARNQFNNISDEAVYTFTVIPPWHQTYWAYLLYVLGAISFIFLFARWRSSSLRAANVRLEASIQQRTREIKQQNNEILEKNQLLENQKEEIEAQKEDIERANNTIAKQNENLKYVNLNLEKIVTTRTEELQTAYTNLLSLKNELDTFIYRSSHDIKGPLMRLLGLCHIAKLDVNDKQSLQYIGLLENEIKATNRILQKLIVYHYVKNAVPVPERTNLSAIITSAVSQLQHLPAYSSASINYVKSDGQAIETDPYLLETAISNIVENAMIYTGLSLPVIDISCTYVDQALVLSISDNGKGIEDAIANNIFDMFFRGTEYSKGAGLGLYIAKEALKKVNGTIQLEKRQDWNTTFEIRIPVSVSQHKEFSIAAKA